MSTLTLLIVVLLLLLLLGGAAYGYRRRRYGGGLGIVGATLQILVILWLLGLIRV